MSDYINKKELKKALVKNGYGGVELFKVIDSIPTTDAIPVEWLISHDVDISGVLPTKTVIELIIGDWLEGRE